MSDFNSLIIKWTMERIRECIDKLFVKTNVEIL